MRIQPALDLIAVLGHLLPLFARIRKWSRLHSLRDLVHLVVRQRAILRQPTRLRRLDVAPRGLPIVATLTRDLPRALPRLPAAQHFSHIDHGQTPKAHRYLPTANPRRRRAAPYSRFDRPTWTGPMTLRSLAP